mmetsp:Transcript_10360/g.33991  ORF Transcript_10360/g.33991 Transcript_10360/m.33991 type:complete len:214 (-) Transcript_10360:170-811(-)
MAARRRTDGPPAPAPLCSTKRVAASTFGPIVPASKAPHSFARSRGVVAPTERAPAVPNPARTGVSVARTRRRHPSASASRADARSLSTTACTGTSVPSAGSATTGTPPPPTAITTMPASRRASIAGCCTIRSGSGDATTRRYECGPVLTTVQPSRSASTRSVSSAPILLHGLVKAGSVAETSVKERTVARSTDREAPALRSDTSSTAPSEPSV